MALNKLLNTDFQTGSPNAADSMQTWGHNADLHPELPAHNYYKLNWLMAAGNINTTLSDYAKFLQVLLKAYKGQSDLLSKSDASNLLFGYPVFALGWFWELNKQKHQEAHNLGNPGSYLTEVHVIPAVNRAYVVFTNCQTEKAAAAISGLITKLKNDYGE